MHTLLQPDDDRTKHWRCSGMYRLNAALPPTLFKARNLRLGVSNLFVGFVREYVFRGVQLHCYYEELTIRRMEFPSGGRGGAFTAPLDTDILPRMKLKKENPA